MVHSNPLPLILPTTVGMSHPLLAFDNYIPHLPSKAMYEVLKQDRLLVEAQWHFQHRGLQGYVGAYWGYTVHKDTYMQDKCHHPVHTSWRRRVIQHHRKYTVENSQSCKLSYLLAHMHEARHFSVFGCCWGWQ